MLRERLPMYVKNAPKYVSTLSAVRSAAAAELNRWELNGMAPAERRIPPSNALLRMPYLSLRVAFALVDGLKLQQALKLPADPKLLEGWLGEF